MGNNENTNQTTEQNTEELNKLLEEQNDNEVACPEVDGTLEKETR